MTHADTAREPALARQAVQGRPHRWMRLLAWVAFLGLVGAQAIGFAISPAERDMGHLQKIMYVHLPTAWMAFLAVLVLFGAALAYLWRRNEKYDLLAASAAEVAAVLTALTLALGATWGRPTWGVWWTWDPRVTTTAVLLVILVGYLALRAFVEDADRRARWSAVVGILGAINVYVIYKSVEWWRTLHQMGSSPETVDPAYALSLQLNAIAFLVLAACFVGYRYRVAALEHAAEARLDEAALRGGDVHV